MGAVESLDNCCADRSQEKTNKKYMGTWRTGTKKLQKDLNRDYGNGPAICNEPLKDLKLDKTIDAEIAEVFKEVGHRFPSPIHGQCQLSKILEGFRRLGYSFAGKDKDLCAKVWAMHHCSRITILQFRAWFQTEAVGCKKNLLLLLSRSRYVSDLVKREYSQAEDADDMLESVREVVNSLRHHLEQRRISLADVQMAAREVMDKSGKANYLLIDHRQILLDDFEALVMELLVQLYFEHFNESLYSIDYQSHSGIEGISASKSKTKWPMVHHVSASACCMPTSQMEIDAWRRVSDTLPIGNEMKTRKSNTLPVGDDPRVLPRSLKFPVGAVAA